MIKQILHLGLFSLALSFCTPSFSQIRKEKLADQMFENLAFSDAIKIYAKMAEKGYLNPSIIRNLADSYYFNGDLIQAHKWYNYLFESYYPDRQISALSSEYYFRYAQSLKAIEEFSKAQEYMSLFAQMEQEDNRAILYEQNPNFIENILDQPALYDVSLLDVNSDYSDYGGVVLGNQLVFSSSRGSSLDKKSDIDPWTDKHYYSLYSSWINQNSYGQAELFAFNLDSHVNDASAVFTKDGKTMYFTRNNATDKGRSKKNKNDISVLKILKATKKVDGSWGDIEVLPFNSDLFNTADPALSPDQKWLYFSSDREQSLGLSDLFRVRVYDNNVFGQVESLGPEINTQGRETFPFISSDNKLYFASDGHPGLGGLDVFVCQLNQDGSIGKVSNLGEPINSTFDDFAFYLEADNIKGFVSSNRIGGPGTDNIYSIQHRICQQIATGKVVDKADDEGLFNARVLVSRVDTNNVDTLYTDQKGYFTTALLDCEQTYVVRADLDNYEPAEVVAAIHKDADKNVLKLALQKEESTEQLVFDLYKQMNMTPIFFEFDRYNITPQGAQELAKIVEILKEFPTMRIDVRSHTDARGNPNYNLKLSTNRAKSTRQWIVDHGIDPSRITATGFGATELLNDCNYGLPCTEEEHSENRRSEFVILSM